MNNFQIKSLTDIEFADLFDLSDQQLENMGAARIIVDKKQAFPCRVSLEDAEPGEEVILLSYEHHKTNSPYRSSGPIYIRKNAITAIPGVNEIPKMLNHRLLSLRAYDKNGMMKQALVAEGHSLGTVLNTIFDNHGIQYIHIHNAKPGCYNCLVERAGKQ
ncbi:MAG: DUF1203 domain-containing protein [Chitinophagaceae bacterium]